MSQHATPNTDTDTDPDPTSNPSPPEKPCVVCEMYPVDEEPTKTSNRSLFNVNRRYYIDPLCEAHDTEPVENLVQKAYDYAGVHFVADAVKQGVFTREQAREHLPDDADLDHFEDSL